MQAGAPQQDLAKVKILFGDDYETNGESYVNFQGTFSQQAAQQQISEIQNKTGNNVDIEWSLVFELSTTPDNKQELLNLLNKMISPDESEQLDESEIHQQVYNKSIKPGWFVPKISDQGDSIFISFKPEKGFDKDIVKPFNEVFQGGVQQLVQNYTSQLNVNLSTNKPTQEYINQFNDQELLGAVVADSVKLDASLNADHEVFGKLLETVKGMDGEIFQMISEFGAMVLAFNNVDVDLKFESLASVAQVFRQKSFSGQEFKRIWNGEDPIHQLEKDPLLRGFLKTINTDVNVYVTVPDFLAVQLKGHSAQLSQILEKLFF